MRYRPRKRPVLAAAANAVVILAVAMLAACTAPGGSVSAPPGSTRPVAAAEAAVVSPASPAAGTFRLFTFVNREGRTIWLAASPDTTHPLSRTGWKLRPGQSVAVRVPNKYNGRFWGRTGCVFHQGKGSCETGDCGGLFQCTGWGAIPATLVEVNLDAWMHLDFYDISMVDGSNGPLYMTPTSGQAAKKISRNGCIPKGCTKPVACPSVLQVKAHGSVVACESACAKLGGDQYCCRGKWAPRAMCQPAKWPVDYARVFKRAEPYAYSYVDDDATSVYTCKGRCNYLITFGITPRK